LNSGRAATLPFGAILSAEPPPGSRLPSHQGPPLACVHCEAFACSLAKINPTTKEWTCPFCGNANQPNELVAELGEAVDFIENLEINNSDGNTAYSTAEQQQQQQLIRIIAVDLATPPENLERIKASISQGLDSAPDSTHIALLPFSSLASACRLETSVSGPSAAAHFDVLVPTLLDKKRGKKQENVDRNASAAKYLHVAPLGQCREQLRCAVDSLRYQNNHRPSASSGEQQSVEMQLGLQRMHALVDAATWLVNNKTSSTTNHHHHHKIINGDGVGNGPNQPAAVAAAAPEKQGMNRDGDGDGDRDKSLINITAQLIILSAAPLNLTNSLNYTDDADAARDAAERYINTIAMNALDNGIVIDVLALADVIGSTSTSGGGFGTLASNTGGMVLPHASIGSSLAANFSETVIRGIGTSCTIEVRCSLGLKVVSALGPAAPLTAAGKVVAQGWSEPIPSRFTNTRSTWSFLANGPDTHHAVSFLLETTSAAAAQRHLYIQTAVVWNNYNSNNNNSDTRTSAAAAAISSENEQQQENDQQDELEVERVDHPRSIKTTRIITKRVTAPLTVQQGGKDDCSAVNWDTTAVLFAKQAVTEALDGGAAHNRMHSEILRRGLAAAIKEVSDLFGTPDESSRGWFSGPSRHALPAGSFPLAQVAFFLHRAVLQRSYLGDEDAREMFMGLLAAAPFEIAERMCRPALHVLLPSARTGIDYGLAGPALELSRVPAVDLALLLSTAAVLDAGNIVYVWLRRGTVTEGQQRVVSACMELAQKTACSRSPQADVLVVAQGSPAQQQVMVRLTPIAADPIELQMKQLPMLSGFPKEQIEAAVEEAAAEGGGKANSLLTLAEWLREHDVLLPN
jgi:hypothetical protein